MEVEIQLQQKRFSKFQRLFSNPQLVDAKDGQPVIKNLLQYPYP